MNELREILFIISMMFMVLLFVALTIALIFFMGVQIVNEIDELKNKKKENCSE